MTLNLACIVEGHGEVEAVPVLIRRICQTSHPNLGLRIHHPFRVPRNRLIQPGELERAVDLAGRRAGQNGAILIVLDSDDECPATLAPKLLSRARKIRSDLPISVVLAKREFEAWFLASAESLRGRRGLSETLEAPLDPEVIRGAKEWLTSHMARGRHYVETLDQSALAASFDMDRARRAPSFNKLYREVMALLAVFSTETGTGEDLR